MKLPTYDDICAASERIGDAVPRTPLVRAWGLDELAKQPVYLKCESLQVTGSFKPRGALNWIRTASRDELDRGLVTISAGNHALGLAWAAQQAGANVKVVMPEGSSPVKVDATRRYGAEVILHGDINAAMARLDEIIEEEGRVLVHPFNNPRVMAGQGTVGLEIIDDLPDVGEVLCPVGGGGLISGMAIALKTINPDIRVIGLEPEGAATLRRAWDHGGPVRLDKVETIAASLGASLAGELTYAASREWVDDILTVSEADIMQGVCETFTRCKLFAEPGAVLGVSAMLKQRFTTSSNEPVLAIITGGNMDLSLAHQILHDAT